MIATEKLCRITLLTIATLALVSGCGPTPVVTDGPEPPGEVSIAGAGAVESEVQGAITTLTALPSVGWRFDHWEGPNDTSAENPHNAATGSLGGYAAFFAPEFEAQISGEGEVAADSQTSQDGTVVTLTATAEEGWRFEAWEGDQSGTDPSLTFTVEPGATVTAVFVRQVKLTVAIDGEGSVEIEGFDDFGTELVLVDEGEEQILTAVPDDGWRFDQWSGAVSGLDNPLTLPLDEDTAITAEFVEGLTLTVRVLTESGAAFFSDDDPASDTFTGSGLYDSGAVVELVAHIPEEWVFDRWLVSDGGSAAVEEPGSSVTTVTVEREMTITSIVIDQTREHSLEILTGNEVEGVPFTVDATQVTLAGNIAECNFGLAYSDRGYFLACWSDIEARPAAQHEPYGGVVVRNTFYHGEAVTLSGCSYVIQTGEATFSGQTSVSGWEEDADSSTDTVTVIMDDDKTLRALP